MSIELIQSASNVYRFFAGDAVAISDTEITEHLTASVAVICGNHEIRTLRSFVRSINRWQPEFVIAAGGKGRGTPFMLERIRESGISLPSGAEYMTEAELIRNLLRPLGLEYEPIVLLDTMSQNSFENMQHVLRILRGLLRPAKGRPAPLHKEATIPIWQTPPQRLRVLLTARRTFGEDFTPVIVRPEGEPASFDTELWSSVGLNQRSVEMFRLLGWRYPNWGIDEWGELPVFDNSFSDYHIPDSIRTQFANARELLASLLSKAPDDIAPFSDVEVDAGK